MAQHVIEVKEAADKLKSAFNQFSNKQMRIITATAVNKTLLKVRTQMAKDVMSVFNIDKQTFLQGTKIQKALSGYGKQYGYLMADTHPLNLANFGAKHISQDVLTKFVRQKKGKKLGKDENVNAGLHSDGLFVEIFKGNEENIKSAFIATANGGTFVAARGKSTLGKFEFMKERLPIDAMSSKSIFTETLNDKVVHQSIPKITEMFSKEMLKQLTLAANKIK